MHAIYHVIGFNEQTKATRNPLPLPAQWVKTANELYRSISTITGFSRNFLHLALLHDNQSFRTGACFSSKTVASLDRGVCFSHTISQQSNQFCIINETGAKSLTHKMSDKGSSRSKTVMFGSNYGFLNLNRLF